MIQAFFIHSWLISHYIIETYKDREDRANKALPLKEVSVFSLANEPSAHHDGLEALALDGPKSAVRCCLDGGSAFAVIEDGQLAEHFARCHSAEVFVLPGYFHTALCLRNIHLRKVNKLLSICLRRLQLTMKKVISSINIVYFYNRFD